MKKFIVNLLLLTGMLFLNSALAFANIENPIKPVTMFKAQLAPCECGTTSKEGGYYYCTTDLLEKAIKYAFCSNSLEESMAKMDSDCNYYYARNNTAIRNGSFDIYKLFLLKKFCNAHKVKITVTLASDCYGVANKRPELSFKLYKNINECELSKKFQNRAFLHHYLMRKYEIPVKMTAQKYNSGIQQFVAIVDSSKINSDSESFPLFGVVTYMQGGFKQSKCSCSKKIKVYAYLIKIEVLS